MELEPLRKPERPVNRDDYLEEFSGALAEEQYYLGNWYFEGTLWKRPRD